MRFVPEPLRALGTARTGVVLGVVLATGATLLLTLLTARSILFDQIDQEANEAITEDVDAFIAFAEDAEYISDGGQQSSAAGASTVYGSEAELFEGFFAEQTPQAQEALLVVTGDEVRVLDNVDDGAAERFATSDAFTDLLRSEQASGVVDSEQFGEIRWGRVSTDQDGAFVTTHFISDAESAAGEAAWTFTWVGAAAMTLVGIVAWLVSGWLFRTRTHTAVGPANPVDGPRHRAPVAAEQQASVTVDDLMGPAEPASAPAPAGLTLTRVSASSLLLELQRAASAAHPDRRFTLAAGSPRGSHPGPGRTTDVLGALAQIEAVLDVDAIRSAVLEVVDQAAHRTGEAAVVVLSGERSGQQRLRLTVSAPRAASGERTVPESARQAAEAHRGSWWVASGSGHTSWVLELPSDPDDAGPAAGPGAVGPAHDESADDDGAPARAVPQLSVNV